ncbi:hypothetical protein D3C75_1055380 [compost metagenome]
MLPGLTPWVSCSQVLRFSSTGAPSTPVSSFSKIPATDSREPIPVRLGALDISGISPIAWQVRHWDLNFSARAGSSGSTDGVFMELTHFSNAASLTDFTLNSMNPWDGPQSSAHLPR